MTHIAARACVGVVAGLLMFAAVGCTHETADDKQADFFPLHSDDTWVYALDRPLRNVHTRMTVRVRGERYVEALRRRARLVDESYAGDDDEIDGPDGKPEIYPIAYYRENGFLYRALSLEYNDGQLREVGLGSGEERFLPDILDRGLSWDSLTTAYDLGGGSGYGVRQTHRAVPEAGVIAVPAGRFTGCIRVDTVALHGGKHDGAYDTNPIVLYYSDWYAPNVGLIRTIQSNRPDGSASGNGPPLSRIELLAYDVQDTRP